MKIGIDCRMFSSKFTGIGRYTYELVHYFLKYNAQNSNGDEIVLFLNKDEYDSFESEFPVKKVLVNSRHYSFNEQTVFLKKLNKENCDIVHFPHFNVPVLYKKPFTVTIHDLTLSKFKGKKLTKFYHKFAYEVIIKNAVKKAKAIIAVSEHTKSDIASELNVSPEKISMIFNGLNDDFTVIDDVKLLAETNKKYNITKDFLLYTGVWRNHKNLVGLIKAFDAIRKEKNMDMQLVITGRADPYYPEVKESVKALGLEDNVIFTSLVSEEELVHLYNSAKLYVFPSFYEGFGLPPLESMKCGTPVVASNTSSIPEVCGESNALFFDPYDENDMIDKIYEMLSNDELYENIKEKGLERAKHFSWDMMADETIKLIKDF